MVPHDTRQVGIHNLCSKMDVLKSAPAQLYRLKSPASQSTPLSVMIPTKQEGRGREEMVQKPYTGAFLHLKPSEPESLWRSESLEGILEICFEGMCRATWPLSRVI